MARLTANPDIVIIDPDIAQTNAQTTITYEKDEDQELHELPPGATWTRVNVQNETGQGQIAEIRGEYIRSLMLGDLYEAGIFERGHGPLTTDPIKVADLFVFGLLKKPHVTTLISDENFAFGGTWCSQHIVTKVPTNVVSIAVSRTAPMIDASGIPHPVDPDQVASAGSLGTDHKRQLNPIFPGNDYFLSAVVADTKGNWEVKQHAFTALKRVITVKFPKITVFNDGDPAGHGEGEFWFRVNTGPLNMPVVIEDFHMPTMDIDDWSETGRPYTMGFAHIGVPQVVKPEEMAVSISSWAIEHDGFLEDDEGAGGTDQATLPFPSGPVIETANGTLTQDCPTSTTGDDFHYSVDVEWTVRYQA